MQYRFLQLLGSYDFFGKSVPGAALLFGIWTLLPVPEEGTDVLTSNGTLANAAALLIILLVLGLMIGQGLHTLAENIEKAFKWVIRRLETLLMVLRYLGVNPSFEAHQKEAEEVYSNVDGDTAPTFWQKLRLSGRNDTIEWARRRAWGFYDSFVSHRRLFARWIQWNAKFPGRRPFENRGENWERDSLLGPFIKAYEEEFGETLSKLSSEETQDRYTKITARLSVSPFTLHQRFQSIYSFCRSMWVVFLFLTVCYTLAIYQPMGNLGLLGDTPRIAYLLTGDLEKFVPLVTGVATVVFMDASGTYKRHYIEYVIEGFVIEVGRDRESDNQRQATFDDI